MVLKLPGSNSNGTEMPLAEDLTQESIDQLIIEAKRGPVDKARLLSALEFLSNEVKKSKLEVRPTTGPESKDQPGAAQVNTESDQKKLAELLNSTPKKVTQDEQEAIRSDLMNGDIDYVQKYISKTNDQNKQIIALNVLLEKNGIKEATISQSPIPGHLSYLGKGGYPINFEMKLKPVADRPVSAYFPKIGTDDLFAIRCTDISALMGNISKIDDVIAITSQLQPVDPNMPFKIDPGTYDEGTNIFTVKKKGILGGKRKITLKRIFSKDENEQEFIDYLNSHRKIFSSGVFQEAGEVGDVGLQPPVSANDFV